LVLLLLAVALVSWPAPSAIARYRLRQLATEGDRVRPGRDSGMPSVADSGGVHAAGERDQRGQARVRRRARLFAGLAGSAVLVTVPSVVGGVVAIMVAGGCYVCLDGISPNDVKPGWLAGLPGIRSLAAGGVDSDRTLPFAIDLLAVCLRAGMPTASAMRIVASTLSGSGSVRRARGGSPAFQAPGVSLMLGRVAAASELGSDPGTAWEEWLHHPAYGPLARALVVTGESGSAVAGRLEAVSGQLRLTAGQQAMMRAQRAGVALMAPLGLCFLPAFVCLGVVPVILGIASRVFG